MTVTHLTGPALDVIHTLPDASVDAAICSPPFWNLRDYNGCEGQWGSEPTPAEFLGNLLALACEIRRVLTPHGSLVLELGDTYAGSGGAGGDYAEGGLRDGQRRFNGSAARARAHTGCPPAKSACFTPELFGASLACGRNLLDPDMVFEPWIVRNKITWARSNPPVGALGDKFRPASSLITVACTSRTRWFDLDAVRTANPRVAETQAQHRRQPCRGGERETNDVIRQDPAGAPPLDHWWDEPDPDLVWLVNTQGSNLAHYAMWPPKLAERLILSMAPERVCRTCGEPSRRIVDAEPSPVPAQCRQQRTGTDPGNASMSGTGKTHMGIARRATTVGWSDCGHGDVHCRQCGVLVPWDYALRGSREEASSRPPVGPEEVLEEPIEGQSGQAEAPSDLRDMWGGLPGPDGDGEGLQQIMLCEAGAPGGPSQHDHGPGPSQPDMARRPEDQPSGLRAGVGAGGLPRQAEGGLHDGAPRRDAGTPRQAAGAARVGAPPQRCEGRQPAGESPDREPREAARIGDLPELLAHVPGALAGHVCPCGSQDFVYRSNWRPGVVLDPFAGAGTTLAVADIHGRDAIGIDLDPANRALYEPRYEQCWRSLGRTGASPVTEHGEQLDLLGGVA